MTPGTRFDDYDGWCEECGKRFYFTRKRAAKVAKRMRKTGHAEHSADHPLRPYRCPVGKFHHIGHDTPNL